MDGLIVFSFVVIAAALLLLAERRVSGVRWPLAWLLLIVGVLLVYVLVGRIV